MDIFTAFEARGGDMRLVTDRCDSSAPAFRAAARRLAAGVIVMVATCS